ncbi:MAG: lamin tail domain-containing protein, partial [Phycisphaerales bacterium]|nr:lamin tail domain-containing protein [Phycisphaerales bacterium]
LFNADAVDAADMTAMWGAGNWIPVTNWPGLSNNGERFALWMTFERYGNGNFNSAAVALAYGVSRPWPEDNARASIYMPDLSANPAQGPNWSLSRDGVDGAYISAPGGNNGASNIGSPGRIEQPSVIITEIMYNPASSPDEVWEWVEVYNPLDEPVDLTGWVLDNFIDEQNDTLGGANIAGGVIEPLSTGLLFNGDELDVAEIEAVWGEGNWIPVTNWPGLRNDGDIVALWASFDAYDDETFDNMNDFRNLDNTQFFVSYDDTAPWPEDDGRGSIYLLDVDQSSSVDPTRWGLSVDGTGGAYRSARAGDNMEFSVGSPANFSGLPEIGIQPVTFIGWDHAKLGQVNGQGFIDYLIDSPLEEGEVIAVTLTWNRTVTVSDPDFSDPDNPTFGQLLELELEDLGVQLWRSDEFGNIFDENPEDLLVAGSNHAFDTVEHFQTTILRPSFYVIRVFWGGTNYDLFANMSPADVEYALAWRVTPMPNRFFGFMELNRLLNAWGTSLGDEGYDRWVDVDYDFDVDFADLSALLERWRN